MESELRFCLLLFVACNVLSDHGIMVLRSARCHPKCLIKCTITFSPIKVWKFLKTIGKEYKNDIHSIFKRWLSILHQSSSGVAVGRAKHVVYKLNRDYTREEFYSKFGRGTTFPRVVLNDDVIGGCQETVKYLRENKLV